MAFRGLNPNVQRVIESMLAPEAPVAEHVTTRAIVAEGDDLLDLLVECGPNTFWVLSEDEETYELVQFPITEGVGGMIGHLLKGAAGFIKRLFGNALDWISRRMPGGRGRQLFQVYQKNPEAAREMMRDALVNQLPPERVDQEMKHFDAKMSRAMAVRTNAKQLYNHVLKNPQDTAALDKLRHLFTAEAGMRRAEQEAQANGQDPKSASNAALKQALGGMREFLGGVSDGLKGVPDKNGKGAARAGSAAHTTMPQDQMLKGQNQLPGANPEPAQPGAAPAQQPAQGGPKMGDKVWAKDPTSGKTLAGTVVDQGSMMKDPEAAQAYKGKAAVLSADGKSMIPLAGKQWQVGEPPAEAPQADQDVGDMPGNGGSSASGGDQTPPASQSTDQDDGQGQGATPEQQPKGPTNRPSGQYPNRTEFDAAPADGDMVSAVVNGQQVTGRVLAPKELNGRKVVRLPGNQALSFDQFPWKKVDPNAPQDQAQPEQPQQAGAEGAQPKQGEQAAPVLNTSAPQPAVKQETVPAQPAQPAADPAQAAQQPGADPAQAGQQQPTQPPKPPVKMAPAMKKRMPSVKNNQTYQIQVVSPQGRFSAQMKGSAFIRALGTAVSTGTMSLPDVGDVQVTKVMATDPTTGTTTTTTIKKGAQPKPAAAEQPAQPQPPAQPPQGAQP